LETERALTFSFSGSIIYGQHITKNGWVWIGLVSRRQTLQQFWCSCLACCTDRVWVESFSACRILQRSASVRSRPETGLDGLSRICPESLNLTIKTCLAGSDDQAMSARIQTASGFLDTYGPRRIKTVQAVTFFKFTGLHSSVNGHAVKITIEHINIRARGPSTRFQ
jgi:hypothetical protein